MHPVSREGWGLTVRHPVERTKLQGVASCGGLGGEWTAPVSAQVLINWVGTIGHLFLSIVGEKVALHSQDHNNCSMWTRWEGWVFVGGVGGVG